MYVMTSSIVHSCGSNGMLKTLGFFSTTAAWLLELFIWLDGRFVPFCLLLFWVSVTVAGRAFSGFGAIATGCVGVGVEGAGVGLLTGGACVVGWGCGSSSLVGFFSPLLAQLPPQAV